MIGEATTKGRRSIRLQGYDYSSVGAYLSRFAPIIVCVYLVRL